MARRRKTRTVYRRARRAYRSRKGLLGGNMKNVVYGAAAGAVSPYIPQVLGKWTNPAAFFAAGYVLKKPVLIGIAGYELGKSLISGIGGGGGSNGGFFE